VRWPLLHLFATVLTEIYRCNVYSCHEILRHDGCGQRKVRRTSDTVAASVGGVGGDGSLSDGAASQLLTDSEADELVCAFLAEEREGDGGAAAQPGLSANQLREAYTRWVCENGWAIAQVIFRNQGAEISLRFCSFCVCFSY
jgi:hypothetical protein